MIADCPTDQAYDACLTYIERKGNFRFIFGSINLFFNISNILLGRFDFVDTVL